MADYIDKEKLLQKLSRMIEYCKNDNKVNGLTALFQVGDAIMDCQTADVQEVMHAKFELVYDGRGVCSNCHRLDSIDNLAKYCRYCGARLQRKQECDDKTDI